MVPAVCSIVCTGTWSTMRSEISAACGAEGVHESHDAQLLPSASRGRTRRDEARESISQGWDLACADCFEEQKNGEDEREGEGAGAGVNEG